MHCYEVIPEGAVCKLYFDLEFDVASNTHLDGTRMVASLIQVKMRFKKNQLVYTGRLWRSGPVGYNVGGESS